MKLGVKVIIVDEGSTYSKTIISTNRISFIKEIYKIIREIKIW